MAKKRQKENPLPFKELFTKWLVGEGFTEESADSYASYINILNRNALKKLSRNGMSALDAFPEQMSFDDLLHIVSRYLDLVSDYSINFDINKDTLSKCRSALRSYVEYLYLHRDNLKSKGPKCESKTDIFEYIPEEYIHASLTFTKRSLLKNFSFRLATQNRVSGDKVWLPLGLIRMIFTRTKTDKENQLDLWAHDCAERIIIHIIDKNGEDRELTLNEIKSLMINPDSGEVEVVKGNSRYIVKTQQGDKDADLKPMRAHSLRAIHIDHAQAIDTILKEPSNAEQLLSLQKLTEWLHDAEKELGTFKIDDKSKFYNWVLDTHTAELQEISIGLSDDLATIAKCQTLQLMGAKENSKKSNKRL